MRKKSHILLARYLADQMEVSESLQSHRKAFCLGSILPDIRPSFLTKKHEFFGTIDEIEGKITRLVEVAPEERNERVYWRQFGEVIHYMADYFTFPHNKTYTGTLIEHGQYEKALKNDLKSCIKSGEAGRHVKEAISFGCLSDLFTYISESHEQYLRKTRNVAEDIEFILNVCFQVIQGIFVLCTGASYQPCLTA